MQSGYATTSGQKLYYEIHGEGEPLLLIMGLGGDVTGWGFQIPALAQHFQVVAFDNRDAGRSAEAIAPYTIADMADDAAALMDVLGLPQAHVVGASMGGAIAQELVLRHPEKVRRLVLLCTMGQARYARFFLEPTRFLLQHDPSKKILAMYVLSQSMTHDFLKNQEAVTQMLNLAQSPPYPQSFEACTRQVDAVCAFDALDRLAGVQAPTRVVVGDQDILTPPWVARELAAAIPGAQLRVLEHGGHGFMWEIPQQVNECITEFLTAESTIEVAKTVAGNK
jgi:pimeloyl-ACP methyl ester carboxylesterase